MTGRPPGGRATTGASIAVLTPAPDYRDDWPAQLARLTALIEGAGHRVTPLVWHDGHDLAAFDLVLPLFAWGYPDDPARWYACLDAWEDAGVAMANPVPLLRWNTDKAYLARLEALGIAVVPTIDVASLDDAALAAARDRLGGGAVVVKPPVGGGAVATHWLAPGDAPPPGVRGRRMLVQPAMASVRDPGEWSVLIFGGEYSHTILKTPAGGDFRVQEKFGGTERAVEPPPGAIALAVTATAAAAGLTEAGVPLYARCDMIDDHGTLRLMELELIEPALFLQHDADGGEELVRAFNRLFAARA